MKRYGSGDVVQMGGNRDGLQSQRRPNQQAAVLESVETEAQKQLRELAKRQADTDITLLG